MTSRIFMSELDPCLTRDCSTSMLRGFGDTAPIPTHSWVDEEASHLADLAATASAWLNGAWVGRDARACSTLETCSRGDGVYHC